ncbi:MAG: glycosyltransferase [Actinobacteria bacterium]|nr:glycosyltransferase [Actinomycetota bacterium]
MSPLVSVVVPVFNGLPHLRDLTESLLAQTYPDLEIVFSEGGSSDESPSFLASLTDPRVRVITAPPGTGAAGNWTAVSEAATGDLVKLVCQDDLLEPDAIAKQVSDLARYPQAAMAVAQRDVVDANGNLLYPRRGCAGLTAGLMSGADVIRAAYLTGTNVLGEPLAVLFRRQALFDALPWIDTDPFMLDLDLYTRAARDAQVVVRKESIGGFRVSTSSWSTRLVGEQVRQFERWQDAYAASLPTPPSTTDRLRAKAGLHTQALLRRGAYRWLALKGSMKSSH